MPSLRPWSRPLLGLAALLLCAPVALAEDDKPTAPISEDDKAFYAFGATIGVSLRSMSLKPRELEMMRLGMSDAAMHRDLKAEPSEYEAQISAIRMERLTEAARAERVAGEAFAEKAASEPGAVTTSSGLVYREVSVGEGAVPSAQSVVKVHYHGTLRDGTVFDSSKERGEPATFPLAKVIPCWTEGVQLMKVGGSSHLVCPPDLAYGDRGFPGGIPGGATLSFDVELLEIVQ